jgi:hypothetical protein
MLNGRKFTVTECEMFRRLDMTVYEGKTAQVGTQFGDVVVRKAVVPGYRAELDCGIDEVPDETAIGPSPTVAFLAVCERLKAREAAKGANVLEFKPKAVAAA